jgi:hypothetical protein
MHDFIPTTIYRRPTCHKVPNGLEAQQKGSEFMVVKSWPSENG